MSDDSLSGITAQFHGANDSKDGGLGTRRSSGAIVEPDVLAKSLSEPRRLEDVLYYQCGCQVAFDAFDGAWRWPIHCALHPDASRDSASGPT